MKLSALTIAAGVIAWLATGERFTVVKLAGAAVTLAGVALAQFSVRTPDDPVRDSPSRFD